MSSHHLLEMTSNMDESPDSPPPRDEPEQVKTEPPKLKEVKPYIQSIPNSVSDGYLSQSFNSQPLQLPIISDKIEKQKDLEKVINAISQGYRILILMRGLPGSGKSYLAKFIIDATIGKRDYSEHILSTDDYFMKKGHYQYDKTKLDEAHGWNHNRAQKAMSQGVSPVIIDNTNMQLWEMRPYAMMAVDYGYYIEILEPSTPWRYNVKELARRNKHKVPTQKLNDMMLRFQKDVTGYALLCAYNLRYSKNKPPMFRKQPPLTYGANWFSCNNLNSVAKNQQPSDLELPQNWSTSSPQINEMSTATEAINLMDFNEETSSTAHVRPRVQPIVIEDDDEDCNTVDDILTCSPLGENNILKPNPFNADVSPSNERGWEKVSQFSIEKTLRDIQSAWGINERALHSWDIVTPIIEDEHKEDEPDVIEIVDNPVEVADSSCNTEGKDFDMYKRDSLPSGYKILQSHNRNINSHTPNKTPYSVPKKLKLDKSCSANCEELEISNPKDHMDHLKMLFPKIPRKYLIEIYQKCRGDLDWTADVLLEGNIILDYEDENDDNEEPQLESDDSRENGVMSEVYNDISMDCNQNVHQSSKLNAVKESSKSEVSEYKSPNRNNPFHKPIYDSPSRMVIDEPMPSTSKTTPTKQVTRVESDSDNESHPSSSSEEDGDDEIVELNLGHVLVSQLEAKFENELPGYPKGFHPIVQVPLSLAKQLFAFYLESVYQQLDSQNKVLNDMIKQDEEFAKKLDELERQNNKIQEKRVENLSEIMNEQVAQKLYQKDIDQWKNLTPDTLAVRMTQQKLFNSFPSIDHAAIVEILHAHDYNYEQTVEVLLNSLPCQYAGPLNEIKEPPITPEVVLEMNMDLKNSGVKETDKRQSAEEYRQEAQYFMNKRHELFQKAQKYYHERMPEVAQFYSELAKEQVKRYERANSMAATSYLNEHANRLQSFDTLDLHYLYAKEAKAALDLFIDRNINLLKENSEGKTIQQLNIITGRGKNSEGGKSKLKPIVIGRLKKRKINYVQLNPGLLAIKVSKDSLMTSDIP